jgi:hypothetical protein
VPLAEFEVRQKVVGKRHPHLYSSLPALLTHRRASIHSNAGHLAAALLDRWFSCVRSRKAEGACSRNVKRCRWLLLALGDVRWAKVSTRRIADGHECR